MLTRVESETESTPVLQSRFSLSSLLASLVSKCRPLMRGPLLLQVPYFHDHCHLCHDSQLGSRKGFPSFGITIKL